MGVQRLSAQALPAASSCARCDAGAVSTDGAAAGAIIGAASLAGLRQYSTRPSGQQHATKPADAAAPATMLRIIMVVSPFQSVRWHCIEPRGVTARGKT